MGSGLLHALGKYRPSEQKKPQCKGCCVPAYRPTKNSHRKFWQRRPLAADQQSSITTVESRSVSEFSAVSGEAQWIVRGLRRKKQLLSLTYCRKNNTHEPSHHDVRSPDQLLCPSRPLCSLQLFHIPLPRTSLLAMPLSKGTVCSLDFSFRPLVDTVETLPTARATCCK